MKKMRHFLLGFWLMIAGCESGIISLDKDVGGNPDTDCVPDWDETQYEVCGNRLDDDGDCEVDELSCIPQADDSDSESDEPTCFADCDGDGYGQDDLIDCRAPPAGCSPSPLPGDCDDNDVMRSPGTPEICNDFDDDCDLKVDNVPTGAVNWYRDGDGDGHANIEDVREVVCDPDGPGENLWFPDGDDCNDDRADRWNDCRDTGRDSADDSTEETDDSDLTVDSTDSVSVETGGDTSDSADTDAPADTEHSDESEPPVETGALGDSSESMDTEDSDAPEDSAHSDTPGDTEDTEETDLRHDTGIPSDSEDSDTLVIPGDSTDSVETGGDTSDSADTDAPADTEHSDESEPPVETGAPGDSSRPADTDDSDAPLDTEVWPWEETGHTGSDSADTEAPQETGETDTIEPVDTSVPAGWIQWYPDADRDGYGDPANPSAYLPIPPPSHVSNDDDCDDRVATIHPGADEYCNDLDDDCDGRTDEGAVDKPTWYVDLDHDGYGHSTAFDRPACDQPQGFAPTADDCGIMDPDIHPGGVELEICANGVDENCDGVADNDPSQAITWYSDFDRDGYGGGAFTDTRCPAPVEPYDAPAADDCDDADADISPAGLEVCDGADNDCDRLIDDADGSTDPSTMSVWYVDADGDGHGGFGTTGACDQPADAYPAPDDCDDADPLVSPTAREWDTPGDQNCDGSPWVQPDSMTPTGVQARWITDVPWGDTTVSSAHWAHDSGPALQFHPENVPDRVGLTLPPGPTDSMFLLQSACARATVPTQVGRDFAVGVVWANLAAGNGVPSVEWDGVPLPTGASIPQGFWTAFRAYGPLTGDGSSHSLTLCANSANGLTVFEVGVYPVSIVVP